MSIQPFVDAGFVSRAAGHVASECSGCDSFAVGEDFKVNHPVVSAFPADADLKRSARITAKARADVGRLAFEPVTGSSVTSLYLLARRRHVSEPSVIEKGSDAFRASPAGGRNVAHHPAPERLSIRIPAGAESES